VNESHEVQVRQYAPQLQKRLSTNFPNPEVESEVLDLVEVMLYRLILIGSSSAMVTGCKVAGPGAV
jgi:DNA polymerase II large subunit